LRLTVHVVYRKDDGQAANHGGDGGEEHAQAVGHEGKVTEDAAHGDAQGDGIRS
jgi:hypothetical protein